MSREVSFTDERRWTEIGILFMPRYMMRRVHGNFTYGVEDNGVGDWIVMGRPTGP
jgi:hypothetical protein